jgi:tellurite resistance protein TehA-like permease
MKQIWYVINFGLVTFGLREGYISLQPERLRHTNPDVIACVAILITMPLFAMWSVHYSVRRWKGVNRLSRPSWDRNPLNWWGDPLQSLFISTCIMAATAIGSALRRPAVGSVAFWTFGVYGCSAIGLMLGQALVYRIYREQIAPSNP